MKSRRVLACVSTMIILAAVVIHMNQQVEKTRAQFRLIERIDRVSGSSIVCLFQPGGNVFSNGQTKA